ncbi:porin [Mesorhizobium sp. KR9-304]|uniref:porin n=1 Tax=Mesorhizobium sp. KR9-304 TaxID=3156614 RepID=UPI0032B4FA20
MNIKSLLLGSAAALVAVSGARAADAVVIAEPEPMEYVRICDTYGVGFYYIPGTETCLKVSGYLRYDVGVGDTNGLNNVIDKSDFYDAVINDDFDDLDTNDTYFKRARFALRVDARSETELGTLRVYAQVNFNYDTQTDGVALLGLQPDLSGLDPSFGGVSTSSNYVVLEHGYLELGGFRAGVTDSYFSTFTGYSSGVSNDGIIPYGPFQTHQLSYTFNGGNGFTAGVALETGTGWSDISGLISTPVGLVSADIYAIDSYMPHVVGGLGYTGGWGGVSGVVGYDSVWEEFAVKGRVDFNAMDAVTLFAMAGWKSNEDDGTPFNYYAQWGGDWAFWAGGAWKFTEQATGNLEIGYDDADNFSTVVNVDYELVRNFHIIPEVIYTDNFDSDDDDADAWGGFLRLQANFGG